MVKDYFQDILQPDDEKPNHFSVHGRKAGDAISEPRSGGERSIRNISVNHRATRTRAMSGDMRNTLHGATQVPHGKPHLDNKKRVWIWVVAILSIIVLCVIALLAFRNTKITVTPRSRPIVFDQSVHFVAYPFASASTGSLSYNVNVNELEDSAVVPSKGTEHVESKANGTIEVFNGHSTSPVRLLKNTRFESPTGLIYRVPATVVIPGKSGSTPGSVMVTVAADQAGAEYNIGPTDKFTLPGLKNSPDMYAQVYARSTSSFTGGFVGDRPGVAAGALESARAEVRGRLESKARDNTRALNTATVTVFPDLMRITYTSLPTTTEAGGGVRIHEKAHVEVPVLPAMVFAKTTASGVGENTDGVSFKIDGLDKLVARQGGTNATQTLGSSPIDFTLTGKALLVWNVDSVVLSQALAGRDQSAFQGIITGFPSIQEARARIEPFWKGAFPASASDITVEFVPLQVAQ